METHSMQDQNPLRMSYLCHEQRKYAVFVKNRRFVPHIEVILILYEGFTNRHKFCLDIYKEVKEHRGLTPQKWQIKCEVPNP